LVVRDNYIIISLCPILTDQEDGVNITANSLHPGATITNIYLRSPLLTGNQYISVNLWFT